jgi:hypothetical protein
MIEKKIEQHGLFGRHFRVFDGLPEGIDHFPVIILDGQRVFSRSPPPLLPPLPSLGWRRRIYFDPFFHVLEPTKEDAEPGAVLVYRTLYATDHLFVGVERAALRMFARGRWSLASGGYVLRERAVSALPFQSECM